ncbi:MAG: CBS domain-containing protein [Alphaproteobacteria bacterium]|nr:CBS domain-containing protein [Alphaproteobacteria bacterium]
MNKPIYVAVKDVMSDPPRTIDGLAPVSEAINAMREHNVSSLVIDRRHVGDEWGLLVVHDIAAKVIGLDRSPERVSVHEVMSKPVVTVDAAMDIRYAIRLLTRFGLSRSLVTEADELIGVVTLRDMVFRFTDAEAAGGRGKAE